MYCSDEVPLEMIGSIKERVISNKSPPIAPSPGLATGFPRAEHRSKKSAFSQRRQQPPVQKDHENTLLMELPSLSSSRSPGTSLEVSSQEFDTLPEDVSQQNARRVEEMTEEEREEALQEIYSRFGSDIRERLLKTRTTEPPPASTSQGKLINRSKSDYFDLLLFTFFSVSRDYK